MPTPELEPHDGRPLPDRSARPERKGVDARRLAVGLGITLVVAFLVILSVWLVLAD